MLFFLAKIGGQHNQLREGAEQFLSESTGTRALIGELKYLGFFPDIRAEISDVVFQERGDPTNIVMTMSSLDFSLPFIQYLLNKKTAEKFSIKGIDAEEGLFTPSAFQIKNLSIVNELNKDSYLSFTGRYADKLIEGEADLSSEVYKTGRTLYRLPKIVPVSISINGIDIHGNISKNKKGTAVSDLIVLNGDVQIITGALQVDFHKKEVFLSGDIKFGVSDFSPEVKIKSEEGRRLNIEGVIRSRHRDCEDLKMFDFLEERLQFLMKGLKIEGYIREEGLTEPHPCAKYFEASFIEKNNQANDNQELIERTEASE